MKRGILAFLLAGALLMGASSAAEPEQPRGSVGEAAEESVLQADRPGGSVEEPAEPEDGAGDPLPEPEEETQAPESVRTVHASTGGELMGYLADGASDLEITLDGKDYEIFTTHTNTANGATYQTGFYAKNLRNVTIRGQAETRILSPYDCGGYAVLFLVDCQNVTLDTLSIGHLASWCHAPVLILERSTGVELQSCDLWGCGYYGIGCTVSGFHAEDTVIRDCKGYIMTFNGGTAAFDSCTFRDNGIGDPETDEKGETVAVQGAPTRVTFNACQFLRNENTMKLQPGQEEKYTFTGCTEEDNGWNNVEPVIESVGPAAQLTLVGTVGTIEGSGSVSGVPYNLKPLISELTIKSGITELGDSCFSGCTVLRKITLPDTLAKIGSSAFAANTLLDLRELPAGVTEIGDSAFNGCQGLTELVLPDGLTAIGASCFMGCANLRAVSFPAGLQTIGNYAFRRCGKLTAVELPQGLTSVGSEAFYETGLQELTLPESLTSVGSKAFYTTEGLRHITLPAKGTGLASGFGSYINIPLVTLTGNGPMSEDGSTGGGVLSRLGYPYTLELQDGITSISAEAFKSDSRLEEVRIPGSVASIGESAFSGCRNLKRVVLTGGVTSIGAGAFYGCAGLTELQLPAGLASIGDYAFQSCTGLTGLTLPDGLASIGATAFSGCTGLTRLQLPEGLTSIGDSAFRNCTALTDLRIPGDGASIGSMAFSGCSGLTSLEVADGVVSIGTDAFEHCGALEDIQIAGTVTSIGDRAFASCTGLKRLALSEGLKTIGNSAFRVDLTIYKGIAGADSLTLPNSLTSIGASAFEGWNGLRSLSLPAAAQLGGSAFYKCTGITHIAIRGKGNTPDLSGSAFGRPWCATEQPLTVELEEGITGIGEDYFYDAETLCHITIPSTVTYIKYGAFQYNRSLHSVSIPAGVNRIETYAFYQAGLKDVYYGGTETAWKAALVDPANAGTEAAAIHYGTTESGFMASEIDRILTEKTELGDVKTALEALNADSLSRALLESETRQKVADKEGNVSVQAEASLPIPAESVSITGAKLNFPDQSGLALVLSAPENPEISVPAQGKTLRFSARLACGGAEVPASGLTVPMAVTLRLPDRGLSEQSVRVWHSHGETLAELHSLRVESQGDGVYLTFLLDGLSDLIVTYDSGFSLALRNGNTVAVWDGQNTLASCRTVYGIRYDEDGRLADLTAGTPGGNRIAFAGPLESGYVLFFLDGDGKPVRTQERLP